MIAGYGTSHDSGVCLVDSRTGEPVFAATLERLTRQKSDAGNPVALSGWVHDSTGLALCATRWLWIEDDGAFPADDGFYALERTGGQPGFSYRWTAREVVLRFPESWHVVEVLVHTVSVRVTGRRVRVQVSVNGQRKNGFGDVGDSLRVVALAAAEPIRELRVICEAPFSCPPDPRELGFMIRGVTVRMRPEETSRPDAQAADRLPTAESVRRLWRKQFVDLSRLGLRAHIARRLAVHTLDVLRFPAHKVLQPAKIDATYDHHLCHAATAYYPSGFDRALIVSLDGMGDWYSARVMRGEAGRLHPVENYYYEQVPTGLNYEIVTAMLGFNPLRHAGKVTGLAAFGKENVACAEALGGFFDEMWRRGGRGERSYESFMRSRDNAGHDRLREIRKTEFGAFSREDIAYAIQKRTEHEVCALVGKHRAQLPELTDICLTGGVFANVRVNQEVKRLGFERIFIQPAMSDAGLCYGAALLECARRQGGVLAPYKLRDVFLGPEYSREQVEAELARWGLRGEFFEEAEIGMVIARGIAERKVVAHFHGRMEFGPRALGNRSILYSAADPDVNRWLNDQLKRTEFMPFAPAILAEHAPEFFLETEGAEHAAEFMTITFDCTERAKREIPAAVHVDGTARPQFVREDRNPRFHSILKAYHELTGVPVTINTSFNMHEEPIVATPADAIRSFQQGNLDVLVLGNYVVNARI